MCLNERDSECGGCGGGGCCSTEAPQLVEISSCLKDMTEAPSFFTFSAEGTITPRFAKEVDKIFHIGSWPLLRPGTDGTPATASIECFCAIASHGKVHVAEVFFADAKGYLGTHRAFTLQYPESSYDERFDDAIMDELAERLFGFAPEVSR